MMRENPVVERAMETTDEAAAFDALPRPAPAETRVVDPTTGGEKGSKLARFDLIPTLPLRELAEHFGKGARKYADRNWERGYRWSLSYAAAQRHLNQFWDGEDLDAETKTKHVICAAWHCLALAWFMTFYKAGDDRPKPPQEARP